MSVRDSISERKPFPGNENREKAIQLSKNAPAEIIVRGARVHNLKNLTLGIPLDQLTVVTGVSGSGKSSLVYDTLFNEGRRTYLESLSQKTGEILRGADPVDVDSIEGLPPPLCIAQHPGLVHRRSTVGTVTEISGFLRVLYSRCGIPHCPDCGEEIVQSHPEEIVERILTIESGKKAMLLAPLVRGKKGTHFELLETVAKQGFVRARIDGVFVDLADAPKLLKTKPHTIELVVDRIIIKEGLRERLRDSVNLALRQGEGNCLVVVQIEDGWEDRLYSSRFSCKSCGNGFSEIEPRTFSFNSPYGACPACSGLGGIGTASGFSLCRDCLGTRLNAVARQVTLFGYSLPELNSWNLDQVAERLLIWEQQLNSNIDAHGHKSGTSTIAVSLFRSLLDRVDYLRRVGLGYLSLDRSANSLSGGEFQRVRLAECLGNRLSGACYLLDEPSAGLHVLDNHHLLKVMHELRDQGNTLIVIEHDLFISENADYLVELGPGAGKQGGNLIAIGPPENFLKTSAITGRFLGAGSRKITSHGRLCPTEEKLILSSVRLHNLKSVDVEVPLRRFVCVTGVSGSGKSSLVSGSLVPLLKLELARIQKGEAVVEDTVHQSSLLGRIVGVENLQRVIEVDQSPLGRNRRSSPATSTGLWNEIRRIFAATREARLRGYSSQRFSLLSPEGRCTACRGLGTRRLSMQFLSDVSLTCPVCRGDQFNPETLSISYKGLNPAEILRLSMNESLDFFANHRRIHSVLRTLVDVGLGYLTLGQPATTLSGGESQRVKLASALTTGNDESTLFFLDEPTTGLHSEDIERLLQLLQKIVDRGNSLIVIEHHPEVIAAADWIIELGPQGGPQGGRVITQNTPQAISQNGQGSTFAVLSTWMKPK